MRAFQTPFCRTLVVLAAVLALNITGSSAAAQIRPQLVASDFDQPVAVVPDPANPGVLLVVEQGGLVRVVQNGVTLPTPFLDLTAVVHVLGEQGLLGLAFPHDAATSERVFVNFVQKRNPVESAGDTVIARFTRDPGALVVDPTSRKDLVWPDGQPLITQPFPNHKGGNLAFGPDRFLYIGLGDGGSGYDPGNRAQDPQSLLGKMLRIDVVSVAESDPQGYTVPSSNPFFGNQAVLPEIWASGYRNPWRYSFDDIGPGATGALIVGDVGQSAREEIDYEPAGRGGRNYGWSIFEGLIQTPGVTGRDPRTPVTPPIADYDRDIGFAVTGGYVYRGAVLPSAFRGRYFLADYGSGRVFSLGLVLDAAGEARVAEFVEHTAELGTPTGITSFGRDAAGELYYVREDSLYKIVPNGTVPAAPTNLRSTVARDTVTLAWDANGDASTYRIEVGSQSGMTDLLETSTTSTGLVTNAPDGVYHVRVRAENAIGSSGASNEIVVTVGCALPPAPPTGYTIAVAPSFASLSWNAVAGATIYQVEAGSGSGLANLGVFQTPLRALDGSVPPGEYYTRVRAINACGAGAASAEQFVTVP